MQAVGNFFGWGTWPNTICYGILIFIFTYFYTAISVNIKELADNMKKYGGFIPGIRPGEPTMMYIDRVLSRITLTGAVFLAFIAILPNFIGNITGIQGVYFGGTSLLIIVGVALDGDSALSFVDFNDHEDHSQCNDEKQEQLERGNGADLQIINNGGDSLREAGYDTAEDDQRDAIADSVFRNFFADPHQEAGASDEDDYNECKVQPAVVNKCIVDTEGVRHAS